MTQLNSLEEELQVNNDSINSEDDRVMNLDSLVDVLERPVEQKDHSQKQEIPESIRQRNSMEDVITFREADDDDDEADFVSEEEPDPEDFNDPSGLVVVVLVIAWPMLFYAIDQSFIKSGVERAHYELDQDHQNQLNNKLKPVLAAWMNRPMNPQGQLIAVVLTIAAAQLGGAFMTKQINQNKEREETETT